MATKGKVPTAKELKDPVVEALIELGGRAYFKKIDEKVRENLKPRVLNSAFEQEVQSFYGTSFEDKCAWARTSLKKDEKLENENKRGWWQLNPSAKVNPPTGGTRTGERSEGRKRMRQFAKEAIAILKNNKRVDRKVIAAVEELFQKYLMMSPEAHPSNEENREVEGKAIAFILSKEPDWIQHKDPNNPGYDLYRKKKGNEVEWCEVKGLSKSFSRVSMTKTEFRFAREHGEKSWLYIVADVESNSPVLLRINDPANKAEAFTYGTPWSNVAEK